MRRAGELKTEFCGGRVGGGMGGGDGVRINRHIRSNIVGN